MYHQVKQSAALKECIAHGSALGRNLVPRGLVSFGPRQDQRTGLRGRAYRDKDEADTDHFWKAKQRKWKITSKQRATSQRHSRKCSAFAQLPEIVCSLTRKEKIISKKDTSTQVETTNTSRDEGFFSNTSSAQRNCLTELSMSFVTAYSRTKEVVTATNTTCIFLLMLGFSQIKAMVLPSLPL